MKLVTETACFNIELRQACRMIAVGTLICTAISAIITPNYFSSFSTLFAFVFYVLANVALYFGATLENQWLVVIWLVQAILVLIGWPIAILGVIFNFGDYRRTSQFSNVFLTIFQYVIFLVIFLFLARIVYSYWHQLRNKTANPQHSVVV